MADTPLPEPEASDFTSEPANLTRVAEREAALRRNLQRRKQQERARDEPLAPAPTSPLAGECDFS